MLLYNVTYGIDRDIEKEWLAYMREQQVPAVLKTGLFTSFKMFKVLHDQEDGTISYSIQYFTDTIRQVNQYLEFFAPAIMEHHRSRFHNKHVAFQTLLEEI
jgi:hypothetical protein